MAPARMKVDPTSDDPLSPLVDFPGHLSIAVILPCYNEEAAIAEVVQGFQSALPTASIYVFDNNSSDETFRVAASAGALVYSEARQGKGFVVRRMFADIEADVYVLADGDGTYDPGMAPEMVRKLLAESLDMVSGARRAIGGRAYRLGHVTGNRLLTGAVSFVFGKNLSDMLSGYRVFSRRFVKSFPANSEGFEIETELTVHALQLQLPIGEVSTDYFDRAEGTQSKLSTLSDGLRILSKIAKLLRHEKPLPFFGWIGFVLIAVALILAVSLLPEFFAQGTVSRFPSAILAMGLALAGAISVTCGIILSQLAESRREAKRLAYLAVPGPRASLRGWIQPRG